MGCDIDYPRSPSPWDRHGVERDAWFEAFPVEFRSGWKLVCGKCGAVIADKGARLHVDWHRQLIEEKP